MEHHVCPVCGYDHEQEDSTPWDQLPADWKCPACSVEKDWFEVKQV